MPQLTLDTMTERARTLATRTGDQAGKAMSTVLPIARRAPRSGLARTLSRAQGFATGTRLTRGARPATRIAWRAGRATGRAQGAAGMVPFAARGWWAGITGQTQGRLATTRARMMMRWAPVAFAGTRLATRMWSRMPLRQTTTTTARPAWMGRKMMLGERVNGATPGMQAIRRVTARTGALATKTAASAKAAKTTAKTTAATAATTGRRAWLMNRAQQRTPAKSTGRGLRRRVRWVRLFTVGFAVGAIWAYLFAPRRGPGAALTQQESA